jgi:hypothetical protein
LGIIAQRDLCLLRSFFKPFAPVAQLSERRASKIAPGVVARSQALVPGKAACSRWSLCWFSFTVFQDVRHVSQKVAAQAEVRSAQQKRP